MTPPVHASPAHASRSEIIRTQLTASFGGAHATWLWASARQVGPAPVVVSGSVEEDLGERSTTAVVVHPATGRRVALTAVLTADGDLSLLISGELATEPFTRTLTGMPPAEAAAVINRAGRTASASGHGDPSSVPVRYRTLLTELSSALPEGAHLQTARPRRGPGAAMCRILKDTQSGGVAEYKVGPAGTVVDTTSASPDMTRWIETRSDKLRQLSTLAGSPLLS